jgi:hypothetical protein
LKFSVNGQNYQCFSRTLSRPIAAAGMQGNGTPGEGFQTAAADTGRIPLGFGQLVGFLRPWAATTFDTIARLRDMTHVTPIDAF